MAQCAVCTVHVETRSTRFLVEPQNKGRRFVSGLASKPLDRVFRFGPQNWQLRFGDLCLKIIAMDSWFGPQNHAGIGLSVTPLLLALFLFPSLEIVCQELISYSNNQMREGWQ
jgi:hypothetical protein